jgi:hypothetical protein
MPSYQRDTTYENTADVLRGSAALSVSPYQAVPTWSAVGGQIGFSASRDLQTTEEEVDDAQGTLTIFKDEWDISFNRVEVLTKAINEILYSFDTFTDVAGTPVAGATQDITSGNWAYNKFILIENQNGDGSVITVNSVTGSVDSTLTVDVDYYVGQNDAGEYGVFIIDSVNVTTLVQDIEIDYDYTPDSYYSQTNDTTAVDVPNIMIRAQATNDDGKQMELIWYKCQLSETGELAFQSDNVEDRRLQEPLTFRAKADGTYNSGATFLKKVGSSLF